MPGRGGVSIKTTTYSKFRGADFSTDPSLIDKTRSPLCTNMVNDGGGMPNKRSGWRTLTELDGKINGIFYAMFNSGAVYYIHAGTKLYTWDGESEPEERMTGLADHRSRSATLAGKLWIVTGGELIGCDGTDCARVSQGDAYIPTTVITREPTGGGVTYEDINLVTPFRKNGFQTNGTAVTFQLDSKYLDTAFEADDAIPAETELYFSEAEGIFYLFTTEAEIAEGAELVIDIEKMQMRSGTQTVSLTRAAEAGEAADIETVATLSERSEVTATVWGEPETGFTVNREAGTVTFQTAPPAPDAGSADGLTVTFPKTVGAMTQKTIDECTIITTFGSGTSDRLVLSGNPELKTETGSPASTTRPIGRI